jgi:signal transduction histidine kinase/ActR/RegA family two-component response regulator
MLIPERLRARQIWYPDGYAREFRVRRWRREVNLCGLRHDGTEFPVEISLNPLTADGRVLGVAIIREVIKRNAAETTAADVPQPVEAPRVIELSHTVTERISRSSNRYLATASHDLRQPLQTIALINGSLRRTVTNVVALEMLSQQGQAIAVMSRLVNALLDISKLESGAIRPEPSDFAMATLFEELRQEFASPAASKGIELKVGHSGEYVRSDPSLVAQILNNLISNAIRYTHKGSVEVRCAREESGVCIEVRDTGVGIATEQLPFIFDEFYQIGDSNRRAREGYGLGLSIVKRLVRLLDIQIEVRSELGRGSAFSILLPPGIAQGVPARVDHSPVQQSSAERLRILLVEDDAAVRNATRMLLQVEGFEVTAVSSQREALLALRDNPHVDLLIVDYHLVDGETGVQVITAVREALGAPVKAVLMTGDTSSVIKDLPCDPSLVTASKPINADELVRLLTSFLGGSSTPSLDPDHLSVGNRSRTS